MGLSQVFTHYPQLGPQTNFSETFESESTLVNEYTIQEMTLQANQTNQSQSESKLRYRSTHFFSLPLDGERASAQKWPFESESLSSSSSEEAQTVEPVIEKREEGQGDSVTEESSINSESHKIATEKPVEKQAEIESESTSFWYGQMNSTEIIDFEKRWKFLKFFGKFLQEDSQVRLYYLILNGRLGQRTYGH